MQTIIDKAKLDRLTGAAANLQSLMSDGHLAAAFAGQDADSVNQAITAFDALANATALVQTDRNAASPFLRYRREIMALTPAGMALRCLVFALCGGWNFPLRNAIKMFGEHEIRIMLECLASFAANGYRDGQFMSLAREITEAGNAQMEVAA